MAALQVWTTEFHRRGFTNSKNHKSNTSLLAFIDLFAEELHITNKTKGKAIPLKAWAGSEVSSSLRVPNCKTIVT